MPMAVLKSMSDVVTRGLICGEDLWERKREQTEAVEQREGADREGGRETGTQKSMEKKEWRKRENVAKCGVYSCFLQLF